MRIEGIHLAGIGVELPPSVPADAAAAADGWTGAAVAGDTPAPDLAVTAARRALADTDPGEFGVVLHSALLHQGPEGWPVAHYVQRNTVGGAAPALEIRQGCNGMVTAVELAVTHLLATGGRAALVTGADNFGVPAVDRWRYAHGARTNRGSILGDAGTAVVLSRRPGFARLLAIGSMSLPDLEPMYRGDRPLFPPGGPMDFGARLAEFAARAPEEFALAKKAGVPAGAITRATHVLAGAVRYVESVLAPLGIDPARGVLEFGRGVGHLGVNDHVAALHHLLTTGRLGSGDHVLVLANGVGVALSCAVLRIA
jgi:3-oxoacyl-[acyl-carrier-protein] synthase-3